jgi:hypothetical protein
VLAPKLRHIRDALEQKDVLDLVELLFCVVAFAVDLNPLPDLGAHSGPEFLDRSFPVFLKLNGLLVELRILRVVVDSHQRNSNNQRLELLLKVNRDALSKLKSTCGRIEANSLNALELFENLGALGCELVNSGHFHQLFDRNFDKVLVVVFRDLQLRLDVVIVLKLGHLEFLAHVHDKTLHHLDLFGLELLL